MNFMMSKIGCYAVFGMTFSDFENSKEFHHGKVLGDAAKATGNQSFCI